MKKISITKEISKTNISIFGLFAKPKGMGPINPPKPNFTFSSFAPSNAPMKSIINPKNIRAIPVFIKNSCISKIY